MPKFKTKATGEVEAFQLGARWQPTPLPAWFNPPEPVHIWPDGIVIRTFLGPVLANWGCWIVKHPSGEMSVCQAEDFAATYELVGADE